MEIIIGFSKAKESWKIGSKIIAESENREYSHAYIKIINPLTKIPLVYQASLGMVNMFNYDLFLEHNIVVEEYSLEVSHEQYKEILTFLHENVGKPYDTQAIIFLTIKKLLGFEVKYKNNDEAFICSELAIRILVIVKKVVVEDIDYKTPSDLNKLVNELQIKRVA